ncbi:MAG: NADAR family protein [Clostridiales bacterium]|jgi:ribA/ribD-fused uncharacterized protein|nr:NADAR family protein [Clostridiales bacterium]
MGYGEGYKYELYDWLNTLPENDRKRYAEMFPPPKVWGGGYYEDGIGNHGVGLWSENGNPKYSKEWLIAHREPLESIFFWQAGDAAQEPECCFSQWQYSAFQSGTYQYTCAEQYMMAEKARLFEDKEIEQLIMASPNPKQIKALGRKVKNFKEALWLKLRYSIVLNGNYLKFSQNKNMRDILLATGDKVLVEASPLDKIWGIGYSKSNVEASVPQNWRGSNLLGFALMEVRDELKRVYCNYETVDWARFNKRE